MMYKASFVGGFFMQAKAKNKRTGKGQRIAKAVVGGIVCAVILLLIYSLLIEKEVIKINTVKPIVIAINLLSASVCGVIAGRALGEGRGITVLTSCAVFTLAVIAFAFSINENGIETGELVRIILCGAGGAIVGIFLRLCKSNKKQRNRTKRKNYNNRL